VDYFKVKPMHVFGFSGTDKQFRAWVECMAFTAEIEQIPTEKQLKFHTENRANSLKNYTFSDQKSLENVLKKVMEDIDEVKEKRVIWKNTKASQRGKYENVHEDTYPEDKPLDTPTTSISLSNGLDLEVKAKDIPPTAPQGAGVTLDKCGSKAEFLTYVMGMPISPEKKTELSKKLMSAFKDKNFGLLSTTRLIQTYEPKKSEYVPVNAADDNAGCEPLTAEEIKKLEDKGITIPKRAIGGSANV
jgi:hypothetical protein